MNEVRNDVMTLNPATSQNGFAHRSVAALGVAHNGATRTGAARNGVTGSGVTGNGAATGRNELMRLDEARARIEADDCCKWDIWVKRSDAVLKDGRLAFPLDEQGEHWEHLLPTSWATGQLCARLGIPAAYFRRCPGVLQDVQANYWIRERSAKSSEQDSEERNEKGNEDDSENGDSGGKRTRDTGTRGHGQDEQWLLRCKGDTLRALLSSRYSPLDNAALLDTLKPLLDSRYRVDWFGLCDESLHLRIIDPSRTKEVLPDDALSVGVHIANSEVGFRAVTVDALVYRLVCKNGLVRLVKGKSLLRRRHVYLEQARFVQALGEAVEGALGEADSFIEQLRQTTQQPIPDVEKTLETLAEKWGLPDYLRQAMSGALFRESNGQSQTVYGMVNAATNVAQLLPDEDRYDLEVLAGRLAEHGVSAYAPRRNAKRIDFEPASTEAEADPAIQPDPPVSDSSVFETAREIFEAEVVGRSANGLEVAAR